MNGEVLSLETTLKLKVFDDIMQYLKNFEETGKGSLEELKELIEVKYEGIRKD